jgi:hypothetical protein
LQAVGPPESAYYGVRSLAGVRSLPSSALALLSTLDELSAAVPAARLPGPPLPKAPAPSALKQR